LAQGRFDGRLIANIAFDYSDFLAGDRFNPLDGFWMAVAKIVEYDDLLA